MGACPLCLDNHKCVENCFEHKASIEFGGWLRFEIIENHADH
jgi:hypothetical protein